MEETKEKNKGGRPTDFKPEYCEMLIDHLKGGNSFTSFGAIVRCSEKTLWNWTHQHEEFLLARKIGITYLMKFYEDMGKMLAVGQLKTVIAEEPALDADGKAIYDKAGNVVMKRKYAPSNTSAAAWIFLTKNLVGFRDRRDLVIDGPTTPSLPGNLTPEQAKERMLQLMEKARNAITSGQRDVTPSNDGGRADGVLTLRPSSPEHEPA